MKSGASAMKTGTAGCWNHLEAASLTGLTPELEWLESWFIRNCQSADLRVVSSYGLSFLTAWWPQGSQTSYVVPHGSKSKCSSKQKNRSYMAFSDLATEVMWCHFYSILPVILIEAVSNLPHIQRERTYPPTPPPMGEGPKNLCFTTLSSLIPKQSSFEEVWVLFPFYRWEHQGSGRLNNENSPTPKLELQITAHKTHCLAFLMPSFILDAPQNHPQPKLQDPSFLTSFCWFTCSEFPSVLEVANDTSTSIPHPIFTSFGAQDGNFKEGSPPGLTNL